MTFLTLPEDRRGVMVLLALMFEGFSWVKPARDLIGLQLLQVLLLPCHLSPELRNFLCLFTRYNFSCPKEFHDAHKSAKIIVIPKVNQASTIRFKHNSVIKSTSLTAKHTITTHSAPTLLRMTRNKVM